MSTYRIIGRNVLCNWLGFAVQVAITFFLTPFILHQLGDGRYGTWVVIGSFTGYYGLLDLGLRSGVVQYLTRYLAVRDYKSLNRTASSGLAALFGIGLIIFAVAALFAWVLPGTRFVAPDVAFEARWCLAIVGASIALQTPLFLYSAVFTATQRYDLANAIGIVTRLLTAWATLVCLKSGYGLVGLCVVYVGGNTLDYVLRWVVARRILPELTVSFSEVNWRSCYEILTFGGWSFLVRASSRIMASSSALIIWLTMPSAAVAWYSLAANVVIYLSRLFIPFGQVFFPAATQLDASGDVTGLRNLYVNGTRSLLLITVALSWIAGIWADDFFRLWVGPEYIQTESFHSVSVILQVLLVGAVFNGGQRVGHHILLGQRRHRLLAYVFMAEALTQILLSLLLVGRLGLLGIALGATIPAVVYEGIVESYCVSQSVRLSMKDFVRRIGVRSILVALVLPWPMLFVRMSSDIEGWPQLMIHGLLGLIVATVIVSTLGLRREDRQRAIVSPIKNLVASVKRHVRIRMHQVSDARK